MVDERVAEPNILARRQILSAEITSVLSKLDGSFTDMVNDVEEHLFAMAEGSGNNRERQILLDAYNNVRAKRPDIESRFKATFRDLLDESVSPFDPSKTQSLQDTDWESLSLVGTEEVDQDVQIRRLSDKVKSSVEWELRDLNARMSYLQGREGSEESDNPLRPELFCKAISRACAELDVDHQSRLAVLGSFETALSQRIQVVYHDLNARLISYNVLPKIRHVGPISRKPPPRRQPPRAREDEQDYEDGGADQSQRLNRIDNAVEHVVESTLSMFEALQKLVGNAPAYRNQFGGAGEMQAAVAGQSRRNLMSAIQELRDAHAVSFDMPVGAADVPQQFGSAITNLRSMLPAQIAQHPVPNFIWANRDQLAAAAGDNIDRMKIDIVAMLFDQILADEKLPAEFKMLLGRLQLPVLRVALSDGSFFATRAHPTRRLIDRIASCAVGYEISSGGGERFFAEVERIVQEILRNVDESSDLYDRLLGEFEVFLGAEHQQSNDIVGRAADVLERAEVREVLSINATIQINQLLYGVTLDPFLRAFLLDVWTHVLVEAACRCENSKTDPTVARFKQLCADLVWSGQPHPSPDDRRRLVKLLPPMIATLREGLMLIGYPPEQEMRFFTELMQIHSNAVRSSTPAAEGAESLDMEAFAQRADEMIVEQDLDAITLGPDMKFSKEAERRVVMDSQGEVDVVELPEENHTAPGQIRVDDATANAWIETLERGNWLELRSDGEYQRVRLAWISPLRSFYLFMGSNGMKAHSLNPDTLRGMFATGDVRFIEDETLVDRAVRNVITNLEKQEVPA